MNRFEQSIKIFIFVLIVSLMACTSVVSNKDQKPVSAHPLVPPAWPPTHEAKTTLIVVNPYEKPCCGATAPYTVSLHNLFGEKIYENDSLLPVDDFFCLSLNPGRYTIALASGAASHSMNMELRGGDYKFVAADVQLGEPREMLLYPMEKKEAMQYVHRSAHRIAPQGENSGRDAQLAARLECPALK